MATRADVRRILVALDMSAHSLAALEAALMVAQRLEASLEALYVDDDELVRLSSLPFATEILRLTSSARPLRAADVEKTLQKAADAAAAVAEDRARSRSVRTHFRRMRGVVPAAVVEAAGEVDLVVLGRVSSPTAPNVRLGSTARAVLANARALILLTHPDISIDDEATVVLFDGSASGERALLLADAVTDTESRLHVVVVGTSAEVWAELQSTAAALTERHEAHLTFEHVAPTELEDIVQALGGAAIGLLVLAASADGITPDQIRQLAEQADYPILIVNPASNGSSVV